MNPPLTILMQIEKVECHNFFQNRLLESACSHIHAPYPSGRTIPSACSCHHAPDIMLQYACSCPYATIHRQIYYLLTDNKTIT